MHSISKLLVVVDTEHNLLSLRDEVVAVAKRSKSDVTLLAINDFPPNDLATQADRSNSFERSNPGQLWGLEELSSELVQAGIPTTIQQTRGRPAEETMRVAANGDYDLIMKPAGGAREELELLFGNTDMQLFRTSATPVWIFKPTPSRKLANVMVALDLSTLDAQKRAFAEKLLRTGAYIANLVGAKLCVVHLWDIYREATLRSGIESPTVDRLLLTVAERHRSQLDQLIKQCGLQPDQITTLLQRGVAKELIPAIALDHNIDLLVMGTVGRTGIPRIVLGNTAETVLRQVNCSVLALKPDGF